MHIVNSKLITKEGIGLKLNFKLLPADVNFLSFAQSDISCLASAVAEMKDKLKFSLSSIKIDYLLDADNLHKWLDINHSTKLIVARVLGGETFFRQGIQAINQAAKERNFKVLYLSGDERFIDHDLEGLSNFRGELAKYINNCWQYGGIQNISLFLQALNRYIDNLQINKKLDIDIVATDKQPKKNKKIEIDNSYYNKDYQNQITIFAYLSWYLSGDTQMLEEAASIFNDSKISVKIIYLANVGDLGTQIKCYDEITKQKSSLVVSALCFSFDNEFVEKLQMPIIQTTYHLQNIKQHQQIGLSPSEVIMQVVMPEFSGRFGNFYLGARSKKIFSSEINCYLSKLVANRDGCEFLARYIDKFLQLSRLANKDKKIAITLANYPARDGKIANGVGLDTLWSLEVILQNLISSGYDLKQNADLKIRSKDIIDIFLKGPTNQNPKRIVSNQESSLGKQNINITRVYLTLSDYLLAYNNLDEHLREEVEEHFGRIEEDRFFNQKDGCFWLSIFEIGNFAFGIQPTRGWDGIDSSDQVHDPHLPPNHAYLAFYFYLNYKFGANAIIEPGKHGSLEWLPGKATALAKHCFPKQTLGPVPFFYPFIVNDPGEGSQAKRRSAAVILDHLPPKPQLAGNQDKYIEIEAWIDELSEAKTLDPRRAHKLMLKIIDKAEFLKLDIDCEFDENTPEDVKLSKLDKFLCELKDLQVRKGLHVFGRDKLQKTNLNSQIKQTAELLVLSARVDRGSKQGQASIIKSLIKDLNIKDEELALINNTSKTLESPEALTTSESPEALTTSESPEALTTPESPEALTTSESPEALTTSESPEALTTSESPEALTTSESPEALKTPESPEALTTSESLEAFKQLTKKVNDLYLLIKSDVKPRKIILSRASLDYQLTLLAKTLVENYLLDQTLNKKLLATNPVIIDLVSEVLPLYELSPKSEIANLVKALDGKYIKAGPSGAPSRGRIDVLPTGKNFYSVDPKSIPSQSALEIGQITAKQMLSHFFEKNNRYPRSLVISSWGTSTMRTSGDDLACALALIGAQVEYNPTTLRVEGFKIIPQTLLARPRIDVTLRVSGFFRDAFPNLISLFAKTIHNIMKLDESIEDNFIKAHYLADCKKYQLDEALDKTSFEELASYRVFSAAQGSYGAGINQLIDSGSWKNTDEISELFINWASFGYSDKNFSKPAASSFRASLAKAEVVVQNQDNREHDILDSDDYYQFQGGLTLAVSKMSKKQPITFLNDTSNPASIKTQTLNEELARVVRARVCNQTWIDEIKKHGYRGVAEMSSSLDYLFAFAVTTKSVSHHFFDLVYDTYIENLDNQDFLKKENINGYLDILNKFQEALDRGLWHPKSNHIPANLIEKLKEFNV